MEQKYDGIVAYTDGSSRAPTGRHGAGYGGAGIHGYLYRQITAENKLRPSKIGNWVATVEGYKLSSEIKAGNNVEQVHVVEYVDLVYPIEGISTTNNQAELYALYVLLMFVKPMQLPVIQVYADSQLVVRGVNEWMSGWAKNGWRTKDGRPVANQELWFDIYAEAQTARLNGSFSIEWVRGHNNNLGNTYADFSATVSSQMAEAGKLEPVVTRSTDTKRYYDPEESIHPFLNMKRIYFNNSPAYNESKVYYQTGWHGQDFIVGRRSGETSYGVVVLDKEDAIIQAMIDRAVDVSPHNTVMYGKLEKMREPTFVRYVAQHGKLAMLPDTRNGNLVFVDKLPVAHTVNSGELPLSALNTLNFMSSILLGFRNGTLAESANGYQVFDITDEFYQMETKKSKGQEIELKALKPEIKVGFSHMDLEKELYGQKVKFVLELGDDIPSRNHLKRMEVLNPVVSLVCWKESMHFARYACIITVDGAYGIWSNYSANQLVLKSS